MKGAIHTISLGQLALAFVPVAVVIILLQRWSLAWKSAFYGLGRMILQLILVGYLLVPIFATQRAWLVAAVLAVMLGAASWIGLRPVAAHRRRLYGKALTAIGLSGGFTLLIISQGVLGLHPWYMPQYLVPLAGMIFANGMNSVSLAAERLAADLATGHSYETARAAALRTALIPITNSLFAVGLVSLPGMMTGQILSGVSPVIAARYQIMVMAMIFGADGLAAALFLILAGRDLSPTNSTDQSVVER